MMRHVITPLVLVLVLLSPAGATAEPAPATTRKADARQVLNDFLGDYDRDSFYDTSSYLPRPSQDLSPAQMASVDPKSTPYIIMLDKGWLPRIRGGGEPEDLIAQAKQGNAGAMAAMAERTDYEDHNFWGRLADSVTNPGWNYGVTLFFELGAALGDGFSIWNWDESRRLMRLAAVAGYPEAMAEAGAYLDEYGFCPAGLEWPLEAALRGYKYAWYYVGYNYEKGCPQDGIAPDLLTAYAGYDIAYRYTDFGSPESRDRVAALLDAEQLVKARARSQELVQQRNNRLQATMEAQRERIRQGLPAVRDKINEVLDECIANGGGYGLSVEKLQRLRDL